MSFELGVFLCKSFYEHYWGHTNELSLIFENSRPSMNTIGVTSNHGELLT
jgi:hypothetical protein